MINTRPRWLWVVISLLCMSALVVASGCSKPSAKKDKHAIQTITVEPKVAETDLYYNSTISPKRVTNISSPADGFVSKIHFEYGGRVEAGAAVIELTSNKLEETYQSDLTAYLQAKQKFVAAKQDYTTNQEMWKLQIIARNKLQESQQSQQDAQLALLQAEYKLQKDLKTLGVTEDITKLNLSNINNIRKAMFSEQFNHVLLHTPTTGIVLIPPKATGGGSGGSESAGPLHEGDPVKDSQILLTVGDMTGLSLMVMVSEVDIDRIKVGQEATVSGVGFPNIELKGSVTSVSSQAQTGGNGGDSSIAKFPIQITVPNITPEQQKSIHVGMSAQITLNIKQPPTIMVPISAVNTGHDKTTVDVLDPKTHKITTVPVQTGPTTVDSVTITSGLKAGDEVVIHD